MIVHADSKVEKTPKPVSCSSSDGVNINLRQKVGEPNTKFIPYGPIDTALDHTRFSPDVPLKGLSHELVWAFEGIRDNSLFF